MNKTNDHALLVEGAKQAAYQWRGRLPLCPPGEGWSAGEDAIAAKLGLGWCLTRMPDTGPAGDSRSQIPLR